MAHTTASKFLVFLIPPSTMFIIYGMIAEQSIGRLLIAGIIPGLILAAMILSRSVSFILYHFQLLSIIAFYD